MPTPKSAEPASIDIDALVIADMPMTLYVENEIGSYVGIPKWMIQDIDGRKPSNRGFMRPSEFESVVCAVRIHQRYESSCEKLLACIRGEAQPASSNNDTLRVLEMQNQTEKPKK